MFAIKVSELNFSGEIYNYAKLYWRTESSENLVVDSVSVILRLTYRYLSSTVYLNLRFEAG